MNGSLHFLIRYTLHIHYATTYAYTLFCLSLLRFSLKLHIYIFLFVYSVRHHGGAL